VNLFTIHVSIKPFYNIHGSVNVKLCKSNLSCVNTCKCKCTPFVQSCANQNFKQI